MAQVALNADLYAQPRQNKFFTANNQTSADGNLTGQCVTLVKWFMQDMSSVPLPFSARGDARYVGKTLVAQGHAVEVPYSQRRRGDIICYEYGTYGHIAVQLSGGRVFEENVNMGGVASKIVDGQRVYASRIGSENEAWRATKNPYVYRLKTYKEGEDMTIDRGMAIRLWRIARHDSGTNPTDKDIASIVGKDINKVLDGWRDAGWFKDQGAAIAKYPGVVAENKQLKEQLANGGGGEYVPVGQLFVKKEG